VHIIQNDKLSHDTLLAHLACFDAILVGPGPGSPANPADVGILTSFWHIPDAQLLPVFGVCLGLQSLALSHGAELKRLCTVKHGLISEVHHADKDIFDGVGAVHAVRYHSLHVVLRDAGDMEALAYADDGEEENGRVLMAARHRTKPFWGVQYHPESVRTHGGGIEVLRRFWERAERWAEVHSRTARPWTPQAEAVFGPAWPSLRSHSPPASPRQPLPAVTTAVLDSCAMPVTAICELLGAADESNPFVLLDSAAAPGRYSIIGSLTPSSLRIQYTVGEKHVRVWHENGWLQESLGSRDVWAWIASFMRSRQFVGGAKEVPFWGGLVGYLTYELGVHTLGVGLPPGVRRSGHPDVNLVFVERSVVMDTHSGKVFVQSLVPDDNWVVDMSQLLRGATQGHPGLPTDPLAPSAAAKVTLPDKELYISRILSAQAHLAAGDSYELCQTARTVIIRPPASSWSLYTSARTRNPAPHAAYIRLAPSTLVCASPERFLSFSRAPGTRCELRPIKGTLRKAPGVGRAEAEDALVGSAKEVAENLMIVDLIRHDLHGVLGMDVRVSQFCAVEEYETVWQMVSVIEGGTSGLGAEEEAELGWEVLRRSLPPGELPYWGVRCSSKAD
jgi:para-aminobenzoate synthetase